MRHFILSLLCLLALTAAAQDTTEPALAEPSGDSQAEASVVRYAYLSYDSVMRAMPEWENTQSTLQLLRTQYDAEQKRASDDFNKKYEEFLDGQRSFPATILQKRQSELQEMLDKNIAFKKESLRLLQKAEDEAMAPMRERLNSILAKIGGENGYAFIIDTDRQAPLWMNPNMGVDITETVKALCNPSESSTAATAD